MKSAAILILALTLTTYNGFAQLLPKKPSREEVGSYNKANLLRVDLGATKSKVLEVMGGIQKIKTYTSTSIVTKKASIVINNPINRDFKTDQDGNTMEILWYYTDTNKADGPIIKDEQTPVVLEKNAVVGIGWDFYEDYAKRKGITIEGR